MAIGLSSNIVTPVAQQGSVNRTQRTAPVPPSNEMAREPKTRAPIKVTIEPVSHAPGTLVICTQPAVDKHPFLPHTPTEAAPHPMPAGSLVNLRA